MPDPCNPAAQCHWVLAVPEKSETVCSACWDLKARPRTAAAAGSGGDSGGGYRAGRGFELEPGASANRKWPKASIVISGPLALPMWGLARIWIPWTDQQEGHGYLLHLTSTTSLCWSLDWCEASPRGWKMSAIRHETPYQPCGMKTE